MENYQKLEKIGEGKRLALASSPWHCLLKFLERAPKTFHG